MNETPVDGTAPHLKETYRVWGLLWVAYNAILLVYGLIMLGSLRALAGSVDHLYCRSLFGDKLWFGVTFFGVVANVFFCPGPLADTYVCIFLTPRLGRWRYALFAAGLLFWMHLIFWAGRIGWTHVSEYMN